MNSKDYWEKRRTEDKKRSINLTEEYINTELKDSYEKALDEIRKEVEELYKSLADSENISLNEVRKKLSNLEFKKIDFKKMAEKAAKENLKLKEVGEISKEALELIERTSKDFENLLKLYSKKGYITHLEVMQLNIERIVMELKNREQISIQAFLLDNYKDGYFRGIYNTQKGFGIAFDFTAPSLEDIKIAVATNWSGRHFSRAIWGSGKNLIKDIKDAIITGTIRGEGIDKMAKRITDRVNVSASNARRLVRTETARIHERCTLDSYKECGASKYQFLATLDRKTSTICRDNDLEVFDCEDAKEGVNMPPLHPNCRSTTIPYFDSKAVTKRAARNADGKYITVPSNLSYKDWYNSLSEDEKGKMSLLNKKDKNKTKDREAYEYYKNILGKDMPSLNKFLQSKYGDDTLVRDIRKQVYDIKHAIIKVDDSQFGGKAGKHMREFGLNVAKKEDRETYKSMIFDIRKNYEVRKIGSWQGQDKEVVMYLEKGRLLVTQQDGTFISMFSRWEYKGEIKDVKDNKRFKNGRRF